MISGMQLKEVVSQLWKTRNDLMYAAQVGHLKKMNNYVRFRYAAQRTCLSAREDEE
jgi:hypothetical protein